MSYNFEIAKSVLTDNDKSRLSCVALLYLSSQPNAIDWEKAAKDFGSASAESMKISTRNVLKKIEKAGGKEGVDGVTESTGTTGGKTKKRKAPAAAEDADDEEAPKPKKKGGRKPGKKAAAELGGADGDVADGEEGVKEEFPFE